MRALRFGLGRMKVCLRREIKQALHARTMYTVHNSDFAGWLESLDLRTFILTVIRFSISYFITRRYITRPKYTLTEWTLCLTFWTATRWLKLELIRKTYRFSYMQTWSLAQRVSMTPLRGDFNDFLFSFKFLPNFRGPFFKKGPKIKSHNFGHREIIFGM